MNESILLLAALFFSPILAHAQTAADSIAILSLLDSWNQGWAETNADLAVQAYSAGVAVLHWKGGVLVCHFVQPFSATRTFMPDLKTRTRLALAASFAISFLAIGWPYWHIPYAEIGLPSSLMGVGLGLVAVLSLSLRAFAPAPFGATVLFVGAAAPAAVAGRVIVEVVGDPTSHSLWPIELVLAAFVGFGASLAGAALGHVIGRAFGTAARSSA